jgi:hypothetical protein
MEQQHEFDLVADAASWQAARAPGSSVKYDNRAYLVAAYAGRADAVNRPVAATTDAEEQPVPEAYAAGYRTLTG